MKLKILSIIFFICLPALLFSQTQSSEIVKINGQKYYMHTIKKGESLESIAKLYSLTVIDVIENNPTLMVAANLKTGMRLRIPDLSEISKNYPLSQWDFIYYQVKTKKKLKDIAKEYDIDVKDIKNNNPDISNKPAILTKIRIPLKKGSKIALAHAPQAKDNTSGNANVSNANNPALSFNWDKNNDNKVNENDVEHAAIEEETKKKEKNETCTIQNYDPKKKSYNISFLLPLNLSETSKKDYNYVSFLEGALLAVEKMKNEGFSAKINIKDVYNRNSITKILQEKEIENSDLIIGPFALNSLKTVAEFSKKKEIPLVSPYEYRAEILVNNNPMFFQVYPAQSYINRELFQKTVDNTTLNIVLIQPESCDTSTLKMYQDNIKKVFTKYSTYVHKMGLRPNNVRTALNDVLKKDVQNLIFVVSNDEAFVSDLLDRLMLMNPLKVQYPISIYGTMHWRTFNKVDLTKYYALNMHIVQAFYIDYADEDVKNFILNYRQNYSNEPSQYAFQGYDVTYYFLNALKNYGKDFKHCLNNIEVKLLQSRYKFEKIYGDDGGYINTKSFLLEYTPEMDIVKH